jgi:hypothetical protein
VYWTDQGVFLIDEALSMKPLKRRQLGRWLTQIALSGNLNCDSAMGGALEVPARVPARFTDGLS